MFYACNVFPLTKAPLLSNEFLDFQYSDISRTLPLAIFKQEKKKKKNQDSWYEYTPSIDLIFRNC